MAAQHRHTKLFKIDPIYTTLKLLGEVPSTTSTNGTLVVNGDTRLNGDCIVEGSFTVNGVGFENLGTTFLKFAEGFDGGVLTSDSDGLMTIKTKMWKSNDIPQGITNPSDDNTYTTHNVGIGITTPGERFHINVTAAGDGAQIGNIKLGNWLGDSTAAEIIHSDLKAESTSYALKLESDGTTNLNSKNIVQFNILDSEVGRFSNNGNLGIGITDPSELLHVNGNVTIEGSLLVNGGITTVLSTSVEIGDINLLLGTANIADISDFGVFGQYVDSGTTKYTGYFRDANDGIYKFFKELEEKPTTTVDTGASGYALADICVNEILVNEISLKTVDAPLNHIGMRIVGNEPQIFLDITGNLGLGVTTPSYQIDTSSDINTSTIYRINGTEVLSNDTLNTGVTQSSLETVGTLISLGVTNNINTSSGVYQINSTNVLSSDTLGTGVTQSSLETIGTLISLNVTGNVTLENDLLVDTNTLYVDSTTSQVGIGTTSPGYKLDVSGGDINTDSVYRVNGTEVLSNTTLGSGVSISSLQTVGTLGSLKVSGDLTIDTNTLYVDSGNNRVGINTTAPSYTLDISTGDIGAISLNANSDADITIKQASGRNTTFNNSSDSTLMILTSSGNLGIGVTNPTEKLEVIGNGDISGNLVVDGDLTVHGTTTTLNTETVSIEDPLLILANNNTADIIDSGVYALYNDGTTKYAGYFRDATDDTFKFFTGLEVEPTTTVDTGATGYTLGSLLIGDVTVNEIKYTTDSTNLTFTNGGTTRMVATPNGFFGIGTTAEYPLHVLRSNASDWSGKISNLSTEVFIANSDGNAMSMNSGVDNTNTSLTLNVRNSTTNNVFVVRNDDKVGILTSTPSKTLDVNIGTTGDGAKIGNAFIGNWANGASQAVFSEDSLSATTGSYAIKQQSSGQTSLNAGTGQELHMNINDSQVITVTSSENVGIGVTNATNKLEVSGTSLITASSGDTLTLANTNIGISMANADSSGILVNSLLTTSYGLSIRESGTAIFQVNNDGNVGIGTTNPGAELEVVDTIRVSNTNLDTIDIQADTNNLKINANDVLSIGVDSNNILNIISNGNVGIGTSTPDQNLDVIGNQYISGTLGIGITAPTEKLHVVGDAKVTGDLTVGGNLIFEGVSVEGLSVQDPLIKLGSNNSADLVDSGIYNLYNDGVTKHGGIFRDASDNGIWKFFEELEVEPTTTVDTGATGYTHATLQVDQLIADTGITAGIGYFSEITVETLIIGINTGDFRTEDSLIELASNNITSTLDIGFYGQYNDGTTKYTGLFRDATDNKFRLFDALEVAPGSSNVDIGATGYSNTTLVVDKLEADTDVTAPEFIATCDIRVKENIEEMNITESLDKINKLGLYKYNYIEEFNNNQDSLYGLIAQDVEKYIPEAIKEKSMKFGNTQIDNFKTISQNTIIANLIGSIQILSIKVNELKNDLEYNYIKK